MSSITYKTLYSQIVSEIEKRVGSSTKSSSTKSSGAFITSTGVSANATTAELVSAVQDLLAGIIPPTILDGLIVTATDPISNIILISSGSGSANGSLYTLSKNTSITIPLPSTNSIYYVLLDKDGVKISTTYDPKKLTIAKVVITNPGITTLIQDTKDESWNAYIVNFTEYKLYGFNDKFEEDTIELLKDNIQPIVADLLIGNIKLSEGLKITNIQGSLELDSSEMKILSTTNVPLAKFNRRGTFFYDNNGIEIARFSTDDAKIGNILITKNSIGSSDFISGDKGFKIQDNGYAEFEDVRIRGRISSSVFESDKISAVGGKLYVGNSSVLATDVSSTDTTITVEDSIFALNEVLTIRNGDNQEWFLVTNITNAPTYTVTRDISNVFTTNPTWSRGTAIVSTGVGGSGYTETGFILLDAISNNSPFIDISLREGEGFDDVVTKARLGNLAGITDSLYGTLSGYGLYSDNVYLKGKLYAPDIRTALTGSRAEMNTCCFTIYDTLGDQVFDIKYSGGSAGDLTIGDLQSQYIFWNNSLDKLEIKSVSDGSCFELSNGNIIANSITLKDPLCECCYSYLNSGQWYFHDELGNSTPYVKRLCAGEVNTGVTVCLSGWRGQPYVQIGIKDLAAYDPNYSVNCQKWCVYYDNLECYCNSDGSYGWCFDAHATLYKAAGVYDEVNKDVAIDTSVYTHSDAYWTTVRDRFLLWCFTCASSTCYGYGILCYQIKYKCCCAGCAWTCCSYSYTQPHDSTVNLKTCYDICQNVCFGGGGTWELQLNCLCLTWCLSTLSAVTTCCCSRNICCCIDNRLWDNTSPGGIYYSGTQQIISCCAVLSGTKPDNVYCTYLCYCATMDLMTCVRSLPEQWYQCALGYICFQGCNLLTGSLICNYKLDLVFCYTGNQNCYQCIDFTACNACLFDYIYMYTCAITCTHQGICVVAQNTACICAVNLTHCYCIVPSNCTCDYERLWSLKDYSETQTVLDPSGVLNYLAIGYS
jgi:hypothetical protein